MITKSEYDRLFLDKRKAIADVKTQMENTLFRMEQLKKKGVSKSKRVRNNRLIKMVQLSLRQSMNAQQLLIIQSQPLPQHE